MLPKKKKKNYKRKKSKVHLFPSGIRQGLVPGLPAAWRVEQRADCIWPSKRCTESMMEGKMKVNVCLFIEIILFVYLFIYFSI